jgi:hypothetical protein
MKNLLKVTGLIKGLYWKLSFLLLLSVISGGIAIIWPLAIRWVVNNGSSLVTGKSFNEVIVSLGIFFGVLLLTVIIYSFLNGFSFWFSETTYNKVENRLYKIIYEKSEIISHEYYESTPPGKIQEKVSSGVNGYLIWLGFLAQDFLVTVVSMIYALVIIFIISPLSAVIIFVGIVIYVLEFIRTNKKAGKFGRPSAKSRKKSSVF